jgi:ABC-type multidrug transport system ATPase subunit
MKGYLLKSGEAQESAVFELQKAAGYLNPAVNNGAALSDHPSANSRVAIEWESRRSVWFVRLLGMHARDVYLNGRELGADRVPVDDGDRLEAGALNLVFKIQYSEPDFRGKTTREIDLASVPIVFGSAREVAEDPQRVNLDAEDMRISRAHARITLEGQDHYLEDTSSLGTELNGAAFRKQKLVFGDRFRISGYIFEYTGRAVRLMEPSLDGSIVAREIVQTAGARRILDRVSLGIRPGEFIGILGRSGQGKSTFLNAVCGIVPPASGTVTIGGISIKDREALRRVGIGYVPQDDIVHRELTVWDAVLFSARLRLGLERRMIESLVERTLDRLGLIPHKDKRVAMLSGGQRKRVSVAIELLAKPSVLFLDEPSSGLDPATEGELMTLLQSLTLTKLTVVCTTHVLHKAYLFDRILIIEGGKLIFAGRVDEARNHFLIQSTDVDSATLERSPLERIYSLLQESERDGRKSAADFEREFANSPLYASSTSLPNLHPANQSGPAERGRKEKVPALRTLGVLAARQWAILRADVLNVAFLGAQPLIIGAFVGWVSSDQSMRMFLCIVATMWFGCSNGAQQIVSELPIFRRERVCGQGLNAYILSKVGFLSFISLAQAFMLLISALTAASLFHGKNEDPDGLRRAFVKRLTPLEVTPSLSQTFVAAAAEDPLQGSDGPGVQNEEVPRTEEPSALKVLALMRASEFLGITQSILDSGPRVMMLWDGTAIRDSAGREQTSPGMRAFGVLFTSLGLKILALVSAALVSVAIGLTISSMVENTTQAVLWVPLVLIPQILFGGLVVPIPEMASSVRLFSKIMPSFSAQQIADVAAIFGMDAPAFTNRTKTPVFLSSLGEKESVTWVEGQEELSQDYDKVAATNTSWQNLAVLPHKVGQHKWEQKQGAADTVVYPDSVQKRGDVAIRKGVPYIDMRPVRRAATAILVWLGVCYGVTLLSLRAKETGR